MIARKILMAGAMAAAFASSAAYADSSSDAAHRLALANAHLPARTAYAMADKRKQNLVPVPLIAVAAVLAGGVGIAAAAGAFNSSSSG